MPRRGTVAERIASRMADSGVNADFLASKAKDQSERQLRPNALTTDIFRKRELEYFKAYLNMKQAGWGDRVVQKDSSEQLSLSELKAYVFWRTALIKSPNFRACKTRSHLTMKWLDDLIGGGVIKHWRQIEVYISTVMLHDQDLDMTTKNRDKGTVSLLNYREILEFIWSRQAGFVSTRQRTQFYFVILAMVVGACRPGDLTPGEGRAALNDGLTYGDVQCWVAVEIDENGNERPQFFAKIKHHRIKQRINEGRWKESLLFQEHPADAAFDPTIAFLSLAFQDNVFQHISKPEDIAGMDCSYIKRAGGKIDLEYKTDKTDLLVTREIYFDKNSGWQTDDKKCFTYQSALYIFHGILRALDYDNDGQRGFYVLRRFYMNLLEMQGVAQTELLHAVGHAPLGKTFMTTYKSRLISLDMQAITRGQAPRRDMRMHDMGLNRRKGETTQLPTKYRMSLMDTDSIKALRAKANELLATILNDFPSVAAAKRSEDPRVPALRKLEMRLWTERKQVAAQALGTLRDREYGTLVKAAIGSKEDQGALQLPKRYKATPLSVIDPNRVDSNPAREDPTPSTSSCQIDPALLAEPTPILPHHNIGNSNLTIGSNLEQLGPFDDLDQEEDDDYYLSQAPVDESTTEAPENEDPSLDDTALHPADHQHLFDVYNFHCNHATLPIQDSPTSSALIDSLFAKAGDQAPLDRSAMITAMSDPMYMVRRGTIEEIPPKVGDDLICPVNKCSQKLKPKPHDQRRHTQVCIKEAIGREMWAVWSEAALKLPVCPYSTCQFVPGDDPFEFSIHLYEHAHRACQSGHQCAVEMANGQECGAILGYSNTNHVYHLEVAHGLLALSEKSETLKGKQVFCYECFSWIRGLYNIERHAQAHIDKDLSDMLADELSCQTNFGGVRTPESALNCAAAKYVDCLADSKLPAAKRWFTYFQSPNKVANHCNWYHILSSDTPRKCPHTGCATIPAMTPMQYANHKESVHLVRLTKYVAAGGERQPLADGDEAKLLLSGQDRKFFERRNGIVDVVDEDSGSDMDADNEPDSVQTVEDKKRKRQDTKRASSMHSDPVERMTRKAVSSELDKMGIYHDQTENAEVIRDKFRRFQHQQPTLEDRSMRYLQQEMKRRGLKRKGYTATKGDHIRMIREYDQKHGAPSNELQEPGSSAQNQSQIYDTTLTPISE